MPMTSGSVYCRVMFVCTVVLMSSFLQGFQTVSSQSDELEFESIEFGTLSNEDVSDTWSFISPAGASIELVMRRLSGELDPLLLLVNPSGDLIAQNDNLSERVSNARIRITLDEAGTYTVWATRSKEGTYGDYELSLHRRDNVQPLPRDSARTFYETLDLSTPEAAVLTFAEAFQRNDFYTVFLVLSPNAQFALNQYLNLLRYGYWFNTSREDDVFSDWTATSEGIGHGEHGDGTLMWVFDDIMMAATRHDALLIDLHGNITVLDSESIPPSVDLPGAPEHGVAVRTLVDGIQGEVVFRVVQAPSGRWRVHQVIVPGGDLERFPWAVVP